MPGGFLPNADADLLQWSVNFLNKIEAGGAGLGLTPQAVAEYGMLNAAFADALAACRPAERTRIAVLRKDRARSALRANASLLSRRITSDPAVTNEQRLSLRLCVPAAPRRCPVPQDAPRLSVGRAIGRSLDLRLDGLPNGVRRGKPKGVLGAVVFRTRDERRPADADTDAWCYVGMSSRVDLTLTVPPGGPTFDRVWVTAQWANTRLEVGPLCEPVLGFLQPAEAAMLAVRLDPRALRPAA